MSENHERRDDVRIDHTSNLKITEINSGKVHKARMRNYSKNGLSFEADGVLEPGDKIRIAIQDSPFALKSGEAECYDAEIRWRKKFEDTFFNFCYGVRLLTTSSQQDLQRNNLQDKKYVVDSSPSTYRKTIKFSDRENTYEGLIKDFSPSGVFLAAQHTFELGQILSFALPLKNKTEAIVEGQIIWIDDDGLGVIFLN